MDILKSISTRILAILFLILLLPIKSYAWDLSCAAYGYKASWGSGGTITVPVDAVVLTSDVLDVLLTDMNSYATCEGEPRPGFGDAVRTNSLTLSADMTNLGFAPYLISNGGPKIISPVNVCIWLYGNCAVINWGGRTALNVKIGMQRTTNSGNWNTNTTLSAGTEIARMVSQFRYSNGATWGTQFVWSFVLKNEIVITSKTCSIIHFDNNVSLPDVKRAEITNHGNGRYPNLKKEFKFDLACDTATSVSVTFEGDALNGTDNVLKNMNTGNDNIGIQMLFSDNTPVKLGTKYPVISSALSTEILKLNAYYYYKGGALSAGPVKANTTFTFNYQ